MAVQIEEDRKNKRTSQRPAAAAESSRAAKARQQTKRGSLGGGPMAVAKPQLTVQATTTTKTRLLDFVDMGVSWGVGRWSPFTVQDMYHHENSIDRMYTVW